MLYLLHIFREMGLALDIMSLDIFSKGGFSRDY